MTIMDYQLTVLLAPTLGLVIYAVIDHIKTRRAHESQRGGAPFLKTCKQ